MVVSYSQSAYQHGYHFLAPHKKQTSECVVEQNHNRIVVYMCTENWFRGWKDYEGRYWKSLEMDNWNFIKPGAARASTILKIVRSIIEHRRDAA